MRTSFPDRVNWPIGVVPSSICLTKGQRTGSINFRTNIQHNSLKSVIASMFAVAGMIGAPLGSMLADQIAEPILLASFALLMIMIAGRMWLKASDPAVLLPIIYNDNAGPTCRRDPEGKLRLTSQCAMLLGVVGLGSGVLAGMFGVGGGFIIVPALITFSCMGMQRAIGTSLLVITLVSISGTASYLIAGKELSLQTAGLFGVGSLAGLFIGGSIANRLKGPTLQRAFAVAILLVAIFVIFRSWLNT